MGIGRTFKNRTIPELSEWVIRRAFGLSTASLRVLPNFIIIGAQRCGTTSLYKYLCQHPDVRPSFPKEIHYFSNYFKKGINWYRSHFPLSQNHGKNRNQKFITGEATPYYLVHPHAARRMKHVTPDALIIVLLRDPIERAYSHYYHEVRMGVEKLSFEDAINKEEERLDHEMEKMVRDENYRSFNYQHFSYLSRGIYADQIQTWMGNFNPNAIRILSSESLNAEPCQTFLQVTDFLGLRNWTQVDFSKYHASRYPQMKPETWEQLSSYFKPHNQKLHELINTSFKDW